MGQGEIPGHQIKERDDEKKGSSMTFDARIAAIRKDRGLSQYSFAKQTGLNHSLISRYESGERQPVRETVETIAYSLGLSRAERVALMLSAGFVPEGIEQSPDLIDALVAVICAYEGRPTHRTVRQMEIVS